MLTHPISLRKAAPKGNNVTEPRRKLLLASPTLKARLPHRNRPANLGTFIWSQRHNGHMKFKRGIAFILILAAATAILVILLRQLAMPRPVEIRVGQTITEPQVLVTLGGDALILAPDGTVWGWGENRSAILQPPGPNTASTTPTYLNVGSNWVSLATGAGHCLALRNDGVLFAWGQNNNGQIGEGTLVNVPTPVQVGTNQNWTAIATGAFSSMGIQSDGSLWHWGFLEAGYGKRPDVNLTVPTRAASSINWKSVHAENFIYAAEDSGGGTWIWGPNSHLLGNTNQSLPQQLEIENNPKLLAPSLSGTVFRKPDGTYWIFNRDSTDSSLFGGRDDWTRVWVCPATSFGLTADGTLWTWGVRLGVRTERPIAVFINSLLQRVGIQYQLKVNRAPPTVDKPWPIARFVTNYVPAPPVQK